MDRHHYHSHRRHRLLPALLNLLVVAFLTVPTVRSRRRLDEDGLCRFTATSSSSTSSTSSSISISSSTRTNAASLVASLVVSSTDEATQLGEDLLLCPGATFDVEWQGRVQITRSLGVADGTTLRITGSTATTTDIIDGAGLFASPLFCVNGSSALSLEGVSLTGGTGERGGAIAAYSSSSVSLVNCSAYGNAVSGSGGAIYAAGGSTVVTYGNTSFIDNLSSHHGGAVMVDARSDLRVSGNTTFLRNIADSDGGAIQIEDGSFVHVDGDVVFEDNQAGGNGGAICGFDNSALKTVGNTLFTGNAAEFGGAFHARTSVRAIMGGSLTFVNNTASFDGGALFVTNSKLEFQDNEAFFGYNQAVGGSGGGMYFSGVPELTIANAFLYGNVAVWGGGVATFYSGEAPLSTSEQGTFPWDPTDTTTSSASSTSTTSTSDSSVTPVKFLGCTFQENIALADGGGIYSVADHDSIQGCTFTGNRAESSGGAFVHAGVITEISSTTLEDNRAGDEGPAVLSLGIVQSMVDVTFENNTFYCDIGTFSLEVSIAEGDDDTCRFGEVCSRCSSACGSVLEEAGATMGRSESVPYCEAAPEGTTMPTKGGTIQTLVVEPGYFRHSLTSTDLKECFYEDACQGGVLLSEYCASGYKGPYCAVCEENYAQGYQHTCKSCVGESKRNAYIAIAIAGAAVLTGMAVVSAWLVSVVEPSLDAKNQPSKWTQQLVVVWRGGVWQKFPLAAVKIVVVMWQIVTQFSDMSGVDYPSPYDEFLSYVEVVNLDLGFLLSFACVYRTNFYNRLMIATISPAITLAALGCTYLVALRRNNHHSSNSSGAASFHFAATVSAPKFPPPTSLSAPTSPPESRDVLTSLGYTSELGATNSPQDSLPIKGEGSGEEQGQQKDATAEAVLTVIRNRHMSMALLVVFVVYATVSHTLFGAFVCDRIGDSSYLRADYSLECFTALYYRYQIYAAVMIFVYPVGIPFLLGWWLFRHREELQAGQATYRVSPAADLWGPYKPTRYYYEVVECFRRVALTGTGVFIHPDSAAQIAIVLVLATFFMVISEGLSPFCRATEMWLYRAGNYVIFASMYLALLLKLDVSDEDDQSQEVFSGLLVTFHVVMILGVLGQGLLVFTDWQREQQQEENAAGAALPSKLGKTVAKRRRITFAGGIRPNDENTVNDDEDGMDSFNPLFLSNKASVQENNGRTGVLSGTSNGRGREVGGVGEGQARGQNIQDAPASCPRSALVKAYLATLEAGRTEPHISGEKKHDEQRRSRDDGGGGRIQTTSTAGLAEPYHIGENKHKIQLPGGGGGGGGGSVRAMVAAGRAEPHNTSGEKKHKLRLSRGGGIQAAAASKALDLHRTLTQGLGNTATLAQGGTANVLENFPETPPVLSDGDTPANDPAEIHPDEDTSNATATVNPCHSYREAAAGSKSTQEAAARAIEAAEQAESEG